MDINKKRFTISIAKKLLYMLEGRTLPSSSLPRWIVDEFRIEGLITGITSGSRISYRLTDSVAFSRYISDNYTSGTSLERWIEIFSGDNKDLQRSTLVQETGDSKTVKLRTFRGFLVNCYEPIHARIRNSEFVISPPEGSAVFIQNPDEFYIPSDVIVVGVEKQHFLPEWWEWKMVKTSVVYGVRNICLEIIKFCLSPDTLSRRI